MTAELAAAPESGISNEELSALQVLAQHYTLAGETLNKDGGHAKSADATAQLKNFRWVRKTITKQELPITYMSAETADRVSEGTIKADKFAQEHKIIPTLLPAMIPQNASVNQLKDWAKTAKMQHVMTAHISAGIRETVRETVETMQAMEAAGSEEEIGISLQAEIAQDQQTAAKELLAAILCFSDLACSIAEKIMESNDAKLNGPLFRADLQAGAPSEAYTLAALLQSGNSHQLGLPQWNLEETNKKLDDFLKQTMGKTSEMVLVLASQIHESTKQQGKDQSEGTMEA